MASKFFEKLKAECKKTRVKTVGSFLLLGIVYAVWLLLTDLYIACPIRAVTGLACPGCGISHLFMDLLHLDVVSAVQQNMAVAVLMVLWGLYGILRLFCHPPKAVFNGLTLFSILFLLAFGILRNIPAFSYLLPLYLR